MPLPPVTAATSRYAAGDASWGGSAFGGGNPVAVSSEVERAGMLPLAIDYLQFYSLPNIVGPVAQEQGFVPMVKGADLGNELIKKAVSNYSLRPSLLEPAAEQLPAKLGLDAYKLFTGYLSGALSLDAALSQLQNSLESAVDEVIAQARLHI
jgi:hypothetical protein